MPLTNYPRPTAMVQHLFERSSEYMMRSYPIRELPINIRPAMVFATAAWLIILGVLGMAPLPELPINDKALHFFGMGFATFLIYFVIEVPEGPARRVWYIRRAPLLLTSVASFFFGSIISEIVQSTLPWKHFEFGDIVANLLGSLLFLYLAHLLDVRSRKRLELSSLYQPLSVHGSSTYRDAQGREHRYPAPNSASPWSPPTARLEGGRAGQTGAAGYRDAGAGAGANGGGPTRKDSNAWDDESVRGSVDSPLATPRNAPIFGLGEDDEEEGTTPRPGSTGPGARGDDLV